MAGGSNRLLHDGAPVVRGSEDVLDMLFGVGAGPRAPDAAESLDAEHRAVLDVVEAGEGVEAVSEAAGMSAASVRGALGRLELLGFVARDGLGTYRRTARR